ncbi:MAG: hypothetical protein MJB14_05085 [Spirochaetes bacterium]|nr:hypothetical protein [Spirochaetota bacterium]
MKIKKIINHYLLLITLGSFWGFFEVVFGDLLRKNHLPAGSILTIAAVILMIISRLILQQKGDQLIMAVCAMLLRFFNPFSGCLLCAGIAILFEAAVFEVLWISKEFLLKKESLINTLAFGLVLFHLCYSLGYVVTQILTPLLSVGSFYFIDLVKVLPAILAGALLPGVSGSFLYPLLRNLDFRKIPAKESLLYPAGVFATLFCWMFPKLIF